MTKENLEVIQEDINRKFDMVLEGYQVLNSKIDNVERKTGESFELVGFKLDTLNKKIDAVDAKLSAKIDAVAADLCAHRADTEAHHGVYRVKES